MKNKISTTNFIKIQLVVTATILLSPLLSGCVATGMLIEKSQNNTKVDHLIYADTITHIGMPKSPLKDFPYALVMIGDKQSYLISSGDDARPSILHDIYKSIDTRYLYTRQIKGLSPDETVARQKGRYMATTINRCYKDNKLCDTVYVVFQKPIVNLTQTDEKKLNQLGFNCRPNEELLQCEQALSIVIHLAHKIPNDNLPYRLKQPIDFSIHEQYTKNGKKPSIMLTPVAVAVDAVTFPLQFLIGWGMLLNNHN